MAGPIAPVVWGRDPEFFGPRHAVRVGRVVRALLAACPPPARILDAGCGAGSVARRLAGLGYTVSGIDGSAAFIRHAEAQPAPPGGRPPDYRVGTLAPLPWPDASFDAAVCGEVLEHLPDDAAAVAELHRVLAPGGWLVVTVPADPALWDASDDWAGHVRRYPAEGLQALLAAGGFEAVRLTRWGFPLVRLYHRLVFLPLIARKGAAPDGAPSPPLRGWKRLASRVVGAVLELDRLFDGRGPGIGWLAIARKPAS